MFESLSAETAVQIEQQLFPGLLMFGEDAGSAGAEPAEGALQIALAHFLPTLLAAQVALHSAAALWCRL